MRNVKPPTLAEVIELRERAPGSLESAAASINRHIDLFLRADASQSAHRVRAGFELIAVRKRIPHGEWETWCADNIHRSMRDIQKLMALAGVDDPEAAAEEERSSNREAQQRSRNRAKAADVSRICSPDVADVSPVEATNVGRLVRDFMALDEDQKAEFMFHTGLEKRHRG
jgi:hypothetical protein